MKLLSLLLLLLVACGPPPESIELPPEIDAGEVDAGEEADAGACSHGYTDAGECDDTWRKAAPPKRAVQKAQ